MENNIVNKETSANQPSDRRKYLIGGLIAFLIIVSLAGLVYWLYTRTRIAIDTSEIVAPHIALSAKVAGTLEEIMVKEGDLIGSNTPVARIGDQLVKSDRAGLVIGVNNNIGKNFNPGEAVVTMIYPDELRVVGHIAEDKGLNAIKIGQRALFTVDAFGSQEYAGTVDAISETSNDTSVVFSISDKRPEKQFDVKVRFNITEYPELKDGMSAKIWIYKN
jgi:multidrug resistance efflux pump